MKGARSLAGVVMIALLVSTLVTAFMVGEEGSYAIVKAEYGVSGRSRVVSGITLLAKRSMGSLRLSHFALVNRTDLVQDRIWEGEPAEICEQVPSIKSYLDTSRAVGIEPQISQFSMELTHWLDHDTKVRKKYEAYLYDFSEIVLHAVPETIMHSLQRPVYGRGHLWDYYDAFACLFDENRKLAYFYIGVADFYINRVISIEELTVQRNDDRSTYYGVTGEGEIMQGVLSTLGVPPRGIARFEDVRRNDMLSVVMSIDSSKMPLRDGTYSRAITEVMQIIQISENEVEPEYIVNAFDPPRPAPKT